MTSRIVAATWLSVSRRGDEDAAFSTVGGTSRRRAASCAADACAARVPRQNVGTPQR
ncbi:MAG: hypothetical protein AVDCRST_MAG08-2120 [uncultured Acetobacteraceae bacterium]|uniref:Uncharacterized protein n=1 Tax=uncultured Acetobacteraceae bacterium TaxID=169975 RepID=A0A6J4IIS6_9PROT|nr:MAG: hypothetical protein AVDCRST_MAG08-2120 [uncultured Acetobacteraceae bacterium]